MVYLVILFFILFGIVRYDYFGKERGRLFLWIFICIFLVCVAGLRYRLGQDTVMYMKDYKAVHPIDQLSSEDFEDSRFAPGFIVLTSFFKLITDEFTLFQFFQALVVNTVMFYFLYRNCRHIFFAALIYFVFSYFLLSFQQMREAFAVVIFLLAWPAFKSGKWIWWYVASLVAVTFHISAFLMFILPAICLPGVRQIFIFGSRTWLVSLCVIVLAVAVQAVFFRYIEMVALTESMMERAQTYEKSHMGGGMLNFNGIVAAFIKEIAYPVMALYCLKKKKENEGINVNKFDKGNAMVLMSVYISIFSIFVSILSRFNNYFFPFVIVILSNWVFSFIEVGSKKVRLNLVYWVILFMPMFLFQLTKYNGSVNKSGTLKGYMVYYPYSSYFDKTLDADREKAIRYIIRKN